MKKALLVSAFLYEIHKPTLSICVVLDIALSCLKTSCDPRVMPNSLKSFFYIYLYKSEKVELYRRSLVQFFSLTLIPLRSAHYATNEKVEVITKH